MRKDTDIYMYMHSHHALRPCYTRGRYCTYYELHSDTFTEQYVVLQKDNNSIT